MYFGMIKKTIHIPLKGEAMKKIALIALTLMGASITSISAGIVSQWKGESGNIHVFTTDLAYSSAEATNTCNKSCPHTVDK